MKLPGLLFLYGFLPLLFISYWLCRSLKAKNIVLLVFSLVFCAFGGIWSLALLMFGSLCTWLAAGCIEKASTSGHKTGFLIANAVFLTPGFFVSKGLNITAAYYSLQLISYSLSVYRGQAQAREKYSEVLLYGAMFPQLTAGPLTDYRVMSRELFERRQSSGNILKGVRGFCYGLAMVALLSNTCIAASDTLFDASVRDMESMSVLSGWVGIITYGLGIYLRLAGLCRMATGVGLILGFHLPDNYRYPFAAKSVTEFWNRFNITVTAFFKDNIRLPAAIVCVVISLWYGTKPGFILCGIYFAVIVCLEKLFAGKHPGKLKVLPRIYTLAAVALALPLIRFENPSESLNLYKIIFGLLGNPVSDFISETMLAENIFLIAASALFSTPMLKILSEKIQQHIRPNTAMQAAWEFIWNTLVPVALLFLSTAALVGGSENPMMYFYFS